MNLFDKLPLEISEMIYKISLKEHIASIPENVYKFHLQSGRKRHLPFGDKTKGRNHHRSDDAQQLTSHKYSNFDLLNSDLLFLLNFINVTKPVKTIKELQDHLYWSDMVYRVILDNVDILQMNGDPGKLVEFAKTNFNNVQTNFVNFFIV